MYLFKPSLDLKDTFISYVIVHQHPCLLFAYSQPSSVPPMVKQTQYESEVWLAKMYREDVTRRIVKW